jgi:hypothetical protein
MGQPWNLEKSSLERQRRWPLLLAIPAILLASSSAIAASRGAKERAARTACLAGDYAKGATILSELFVETKDATYIYNQGRCFEQNGRHNEAIARFQEYLRVGQNLSNGDRAEAKKHIAECQEMSTKQSDQPAVAAPAGSTGVAAVAPVVAPEPVPLPPLVATATEISRPLLRPSPAMGSSGSGLRTAGIVTAAVGGAALITGIILNLKANGMASDFRQVNGYTDDRESSRQSYETLSWVSYGVGAACVATGSVFYVLGLRRGKDTSPSMALLPAFGPAGGFAMLKGGF